MYYFFISDKNNVPRREHVQEQCDKIGLEPIFFDAIMGKELSKEELSMVTCENNFLTESEIGCALSHIGVLNRFLSTDEKSVVVFEDDIVFSEYLTLDMLQKLKAFVENKEAPAILALYSSERYYKKELQIEGVCIYKIPRFIGAYAYIINRKAAEAIVSVQDKISFEIDHFRFYYYLKGCQLYMLDKNCVGVDKENIVSTLSRVSSEIDNENYRERMRNKNIRLLFKKLSNYRKVLFFYYKIKKHFGTKKLKDYKINTELW